MHRRNLLVGSLFALLLAGCIVPEQETFSSFMERAVRTEGETGDRVNASRQERVGSGSVLPERLLPGAVLEVGSDKAPVTLLIASNHACAYCREFQQRQLPIINEEFVKTGMLRYQLVELPLRKYPQSRDVALAIACAAKQQQGAAMNELLFHRNVLRRADSLAAAKELKLDAAAFASCLEKPEAASALASQAQWMELLDVSLVPTMFLDGQKMVGLHDEADLRAALELAVEAKSDR